MQPRKWSETHLKRAVHDSTSIRQTLRHLGLAPAGGNYVQIKKYLKLLDLDTSHFKGHAWNKGLKGTSKPTLALEQVLVAGSGLQSFKLKRRLFAAGLKPQYCEECGWSRRTPDGRLPLEVHHINGDPADNRLANLQILCPNCHSLKPHYRGRNRKASQ